MLTQKSLHRTLGCTMDGEKGPLCNAVWLLLCQQMAERREAVQRRASDPTKQLQTWLEKGRSTAAAAAYPPPPPIEERHPPSTLPSLTSINSFHAGQQPGILHIPPPSYLKFISNNCSIKGNVCNLHTAVIMGLRAGLAIHVDNGKSLWSPNRCLPNTTWHNLYGEHVP